MNQGKLYFNEWFEEACIKILNRPDITFETFLNNMRPENQRWWDQELTRYFYFPNNTLAGVFRPFYTTNYDENLKFEMPKKEFINKAFSYTNNSLRIPVEQLRTISSEWKEIIKQFSASDVYFSKYPIYNYSLKLPIENEIKIKKRGL